MDHQIKSIDRGYPTFLMNLCNNFNTSKSNVSYVLLVTEKLFVLILIFVNLKKKPL